jgi:hypothetical protein
MTGGANALIELHSPPARSNACTTREACDPDFRIRVYKPGPGRARNLIWSKVDNRSRRF